MPAYPDCRNFFALEFNAAKSGFRVSEYAALYPANPPVVRPNCAGSYMICKSMPSSARRYVWRSVGLKRIERMKFASSHFIKRGISFLDGKSNRLTLSGQRHCRRKSNAWPHGIWVFCRTCAASLRTVSSKSVTDSDIESTCESRLRGNTTELFKKIIRWILSIGFLIRNRNYINHELDRVVGRRNEQIRAFAA